ncbi:RCC1 domain-containing protein [Chryseobacterium paridis]|uniref:Chromosome condensation regulator RCC1 n=1 Tax=Chryseobacterium paridis TaxID=2800328 RepID=A0ABS1FVH9_9FLAO|nr:hypothetical protein [Chryseobacterium paridis]MBK1896353.1 hypothetical protein [Chryseobacterium paridis]
MKKYIYFMLMMAPGITGSLQAQCGTSGCNGNTYVQSNDPNTIEYDNMVSTFHSSMVKEASGKVMVWGEAIARNGSSDVLSPIELNSTNYPGLTGNILKSTGGSYSTRVENNKGPQFVVLTTDGLFVWGLVNKLVSSSIKNTATFGKVSIGTYGISGTKADGLPEGVNPTDVKMMFGSYRTLAITTCNGQAWVLSMNGSKNGDGTSQTTANNRVWHRVKTGNGDNEFLTDVVAVRGNTNALMALTSNGKIYTWGTGTYLGDGSARSNRAYATEMPLPLDWPSRARPKMIGMTRNNSSDNTYYLLSSDGSLYSLGSNNVKQLGDFTTTNRTTWVRVKKSATEDMNDITWISPQEHDTDHAAINALTTNGKLYAWGNNDGWMLGIESRRGNDPTFMPGGLDDNDVLMAVETGGHTTMVIKQCSQNFGYVGHRVNGSMGNGSSANTTENEYTFFTAKINLCGSNAQPDVISKKICSETKVDLITMHTGATPNGYELKWYTTPTRDAGTEVANPGAVGPGTYYAFYIPTNTGNCDNAPASDPVVISNLAPGDPGYENCTCKVPIETGTGLSSKFGISTKESHSNNWPTQVPNGHMVLDASKKGMVITHMTTAQINALTPVAGMIVYDTDAKCVKLYRGNNPTVASDRKGWVCIQAGCNSEDNY